MGDKMKGGRTVAKPAAYRKRFCEQMDRFLMHVPEAAAADPSPSIPDDDSDDYTTVTPEPKWTAEADHRRRTAGVALSGSQGVHMLHQVPPDVDVPDVPNPNACSFGTAFRSRETGY